MSENRYNRTLQFHLRGEEQSQWLTTNEVESQDERRGHDRSRLIVDVFFDGNDVTGVASTKDISQGGLYMNTQTEIPEGALLVVRIPFQAGNCKWS